jgi:hypothetical protein
MEYKGFVLFSTLLRNGRFYFTYIYKCVESYYILVSINIFTTGMVHFPHSAAYLAYSVFHKLVLLHTFWKS